MRKKPDPRKRGPARADALPWTGHASFFDHDVQRALEDLERVLPVGRPIQAFEMADAIMRKPALRQDSAWRVIRQLVEVAPVEASALLSALAQFHAVPPKQWTVARKLDALNNLLGEAPPPRPIGTRGPAPKLASWPRVAEAMKRRFAIEFNADHLRDEYTNERRRRLRCLSRWENHFAALNGETA